MSDKSLAKLLKASEQASHDQLQHLLVVLTPDGRVQVIGSANIVGCVTENTELYQALHSTMLDNMQTSGDTITPSRVIDYPLLPCSPFSPQWKGSAMIRGVLSKMLLSVGYGKSGRNRKLGVGTPPLGWPLHIPWANFSGSTRSKHPTSSKDVTDIIISLLQAANIDPDTHVKQIQESTEYGLEPEIDISVQEQMQIKTEHIDEEYDINRHDGQAQINFENLEKEMEARDPRDLPWQNFEVKREAIDPLDFGLTKKVKTEVEKE